MWAGEVRLRLARSVLAVSRPWAELSWSAQLEARRTEERRTESSERLATRCSETEG